VQNYSFYRGCLCSAVAGPTIFFKRGRPFATEITFNCWAYYTQCLISGGFECSNSWIYWVLLRCPWMSLLERWNWSHTPDLPSLASPFQASLFHINDFYQYDLMHLSKLSETRHWMEPRKSVSNRAPHLLRPALGVVVWERHSHTFFTFCFEMNLKLFLNGCFLGCVSTLFLLALHPCLRGSCPGGCVVLELYQKYIVWILHEGIKYIPTVETLV